MGSAELGAARDGCQQLLLVQAKALVVEGSQRAELQAAPTIIEELLEQMLLQLLIPDLLVVAVDSRVVHALRSPALVAETQDGKDLGVDG